MVKKQIIITFSDKIDRKNIISEVSSLLASRLSPKTQKNILVWCLSNMDKYKEKIINIS